MELCSCRERERGRSRELRGRSVERERERSRERERERERDRQLERERERERARDREPRREARESSAAVNDSTSMRRKDVCLFLSIAYLAKFCTVVSSTVVDLWIPAMAVDKDGGEAHGVLPDSGVAEQERNSAEPCLRSGSGLAFLLVDVSSCQRQGRSAGLLGPQAAAVRPPGALCRCDCFPGFAAHWRCRCHRHGRQIFSYIYIYLRSLCLFFFSPLGLGCLFAFFLCPFFFHVFAF